MEPEHAAATGLELEALQDLLLEVIVCAALRRGAVKILPPPEYALFILEDDVFFRADMKDCCRP